MEVYLIDSCMWIELLRGSNIGKSVEKYVNSDNEILISAISLTEIYHYILKKRYSEEFINFLIKRTFIIPVVQDIALKAAEIQHDSKLSIADAIIYATALLNDAKLLTCDSDFRDKDNVVYVKK